jgi:hypothetical protein
MKQFITRAYNNFEVDELRSTITKVSETDRLADEIGYYTDIRNTSIGVFFPRLASYYTGKTNRLELEYYNYPDLGYQMFSVCDWDRISQKLNSILDMFEDYRYLVNGQAVLTGGKTADFSSDLKRAMYVDKTVKYQKELVSEFEYFKSLDRHNEVIVNGKPLLNFSSVWPKALRLIESKLLDNKPISAIHGDMCFSNILYDPDLCTLRLLDPRGSFGEKGFHGDPRYDVAKLRHSYHGGYEFIIQDKFTVNYQDNSINFELDYPESLKNTITNSFERHDRFSNEDCKLIEGLIFIGMCSRHYDSLDRQVIMYATGLEILNEVVA